MTQFRRSRRSATRYCSQFMLAMCALTLTLLMSSLDSHGAEKVYTDDYRHERQLYKQARRALKVGKRASFNRLKQQLADYPLLPYLEYSRLRKDLRKASPNSVRKFFAHYPDIPLNRRLRRAWLHELARRKNWKAFIKDYTEQSSAELQCYYQRALLAEGKTRKVMRATQKLWLVGHSQPDACDPLFDLLKDSGQITTRLRWQRIELAMGENNPGLAKYLARELPASDRQWASLWRSVYHNPAKNLSDPRLNRDTDRARKIILQGLARLARSKPLRAWDRWQKISSSYDFDREQRGKLEYEIALRAALRKKPGAYRLLAQVPVPYQTEKSREWRTRSALIEQDWNAALEAIDHMPRSERNRPEWRYWKARALDEVDQHKAAHSLYRNVADERSYFGFLAADRIKEPYTLNNSPISADEDRLSDLARIPGIIRAHELLRVGESLNARSEWYWATRDMGKRDIAQAAVLADRWHWHDRAIVSASKAEQLNDLPLRFPVPYKRHTLKTARDLRLEPSWIFGVMRQESAFMTDVRSSAGAVGLMQLMPATGRNTARSYNIPLRNTSQLLLPEKNIRIGSSYLKKMYERFDRNMVLATAAYNAGPHRVDRWLPKSGAVDAALWAESIPFTETRNYVRGVLAFTTVFDWRLTDRMKPISSRMKAVRAKRK